MSFKQSTVMGHCILSRAGCFQSLYGGMMKEFLNENGFLSGFY